MFRLRTQIPFSLFSEMFDWVLNVCIIIFVAHSLLENDPRVTRVLQDDLGASRKR